MPAMTLSEFLLARIESDEVMLRAIRCAVQETADFHPGIPLEICDCSTVVDGVHDWNCPERLAAECEAKRRIVKWAEGPYRDPLDAASYQALRLLALPYADHPDYRQEWKP